MAIRIWLKLEDSALCIAVAPLLVRNDSKGFPGGRRTENIKIHWPIALTAIVEREKMMLDRIEKLLCYDRQRFFIQWSERDLNSAFRIAVEWTPSHSQAP